MRSRFDEQLDNLFKDLIMMGSLCEEAIALAAKALSKNDSKLAAKVHPIDEEIDRMEKEIESNCLKLLLQQQPVARDLRQISAALKMITDMERIGDQAEDIAEIVSFIPKDKKNDSLLIEQMAKAAIKMVTDSVDAYVRRDPMLAQSVIDSDDTVDHYFDQVKSSLISLITENPDDGEYALDILMIAKYLERIGDHAVNIAEWVLFSITGIHKTTEEHSV
ncbi:MAG: phosphate signaling complex protein PhoU [Clostridia bacterium]|nr:phosphate signaling complex protein PhoU [Clostridia bacterium]MBR2473075.1 phosphate signaling complex protein PhoU [Clostridia bacterium]MBR3865133.1 phosphate signaling complex protein PhoU [Clostridia bacterium]